MKKIITRVALSLLMMNIFLSPAVAALPSEQTMLPTDPQPAEIRAAIKEYKSLSRKEKRARIREAKEVLKQYKAKKSAAREDSEVSTVLLVILAIFLPPLAVYLHQGEINTKFWISLVLTLLFFIPGVIYSLLVVLDAV